MPTVPCIAVATDATPRATAPLNAQQISALHPALVRVARRMVGNTTLADDVVQETWLSALQYADRFEGRASLFTWLVAIMRRRMIDLHRKSKLRTLELEEGAWSTESTFAQEADARDYLQKMAGAFEALSERELAAVMLCHVSGQDRAAAADELGVTRAHLRVLLHRAHTRLQDYSRAHLGPVSASHARRAGV